MKPQDAIGPVQESIQESARVAARRRLLRGSLAVPAVLTLSSGAALANTSSPVRCFNNTLETDFSNTNWAVNQYQVVRTHDGKVETFYVVNGGELLAIANASGGSIEVPTGFVGGSYVRVTPFGLVNLATGEPSATSFGTVAPRFTLRSNTLVFDITGLIPTGSQGVAGGNGRIITTSCWTSFKPPMP